MQLRATGSEMSAARLAFLFVCGAMIANLVFNIAAAAAGWAHPYSFFLFLPQDRFGDFFKLAFTYPGPPIHGTSDLLGMADHFERFHQEVAMLEGTKLNHFHVPPLPTLMAFTWRQAMSVVDPMLLFLLLAVAGVATLVAVVTRHAARDAQASLLGLLAAVNYPLALMLDRGHFFSLVCAIALIVAILRSTTRARADWVAIALFAVAMNIRPHAAIFPLLLFLCGRGWSLLDMVKLGFACLVVFGLALGITNAAYPQYHLFSFWRGLEDYSQLYIAGDFGLAYGSSLLGAAKALFGFGAAVFWGPLLIAGALTIGIIVQDRRERLPDAALIFLMCSVYTLGTQVFADYHLLVFLAPIAIMVRNGGLKTRGDLAVLIGCCFVLAPKNYFFQYEPERFPWSWQILLNPLVLLAASTYILVRAQAARPHGPSRLAVQAPR